MPTLPSFHELTPADRCDLAAEIEVLEEKIDGLMVSFLSLGYVTPREFFDSMEAVADAA